MSDVFDEAKRSEVMSRIRGYGNLTTEMALATAMRKAKIAGWRRHVELRPKNPASGIASSKKAKRIVVKPDFLFRKPRLAVFVDGCFWHGCPLHAKIPATNTDFWRKKLGANIERDRHSTKALELAGWTILRIWEHELADTDGVIQRLRNVLSRLSYHSHGKNKDE